LRGYDASRQDMGRIGGGERRRMFRVVDRAIGGDTALAAKNMDFRCFIVK